MASPTRSLGPYQLLQPLARGGMGAVHLARRRGSQTLCVLKELLQHAAEDPDLERRFRREAHLTSLLDHPNIARVLDAGSAEDRFYIAFEFVPGVSVARLAQKLGEQAQWLAPAVGIGIVGQVLDGLTHAHAQPRPDGRPLGLVHRDLTPANIMVSFDGVVKIIDFGVASARIDGHRTLPGHTLGTAAYMSPEQVRGQELDARSDLYTVGVVLFELLTARRVVGRRGYGAILEAIVEERPPPVSQVEKTLPPSLDPVVARALEKNPDDRWPDAVRFRDALMAAGPGLPDDRVLPNMLRGLFPEVIEETGRWLQTARQAAVTERGAPQQHRATAIRENPHAADTAQDVQLLAPTERIDLHAEGPSAPAEVDARVQLTARPPVEHVVSDAAAAAPTVLDPRRPGTAGPAPMAEPALPRWIYSRWLMLVVVTVAATLVALIVVQSWLRTRPAPVAPGPASTQTKPDS